MIYVIAFFLLILIILLGITIVLLNQIGTELAGLNVKFHPRLQDRLALYPRFVRGEEWISTRPYWDWRNT